MAAREIADNVVTLDFSRTPSGEFADVFERLRRTPCTDDAQGPPQDESAALSPRSQRPSKAGSGAKLDHRKPDIGEGMTQNVKPPACGLAVPEKRPNVPAMTREAMTAHFVTDIKRFVHDLEKVLGAIRERSHNDCNAIPVLVHALSRTREWFPYFNKPEVRKLFLSHAELLQCHLSIAARHAADLWGEEGDIVRDLAKENARVTKWVETLAPLD